MRCVRNAFILLLVASAPVPAAEPAPPASEDERRILALHEAGLKAHMDGDIDALLSTQSEDFLLVDRGEVSSPSKQERRDFLGPYLASTKFEYYRDKVPPLVRVSRDGTLGWVAAQIEARGHSMGPDGKTRQLEAVFAWIELYERRGDEWVSTGNATSFKRD
jgi:hypothetical protein